MYYDFETAEIARKYLAGSYFQGRDIKISYDLNKNVSMNLETISDQELFVKQLRQLNSADRQTLLGMMKNTY